jgi:5-methylcytosine-specific restriction endonuclease McrA
MAHRNPYLLTPEWKALREYCLERDDYTCTVPHCGGPAFVVDHIVARNAGGPDHPDNLRSLCKQHDGMVREKTFGQADRKRGGVIAAPCDFDGMPRDPTHPWYKKRA